MPDERMLEEKKRLRRECAQKLTLLQEKELREAGAAIFARVLETAVYHRAASLFVYVSTPKEPDTRALMEHAWAAGKKVLVPKCRGNGAMDAVRVSSWADLAPGAMGIPEPRRDGPAEHAFDLAIVPCVCAGRNGRRLGHGAGYYDRFLALHPAPTMCLCFQALLAENVPQSPLDVMMDAVATEKALYVSKKGKRFFSISGQERP